MKVIIYTSITNKYDRLKKAPDLNVEGVEFKYILYTDAIYKDSKGWEQRELKYFLDDPRKASRYYKINSHLLPAHDWSVWYDGSFKILKSPLDLFPKRSFVSIPKHKKDKCPYRHAIRLHQNGLDDIERMSPQLDRYREEGLPRRYMLSENGFIIRKNTPEVTAFNKVWWQEYKDGSCRDQLSLPYAVWKTKIRFEYTPVNNRDNEYYKGWGDHRLEKR
jgi:hypothetical protein